MAKTTTSLLAAVAFAVGLAAMSAAPAVAAPPPAPFRGAERLPPLLRASDRAIARLLVLETRVLAEMRSLRAIVATHGDAAPADVRAALATLERIAEPRDIPPQSPDEPQMEPAPPPPETPIGAREVALPGGETARVVDADALAERLHAVRYLVRFWQSDLYRAREDDPAAAAWDVLCAHLLGNASAADAGDVVRALARARRAELGDDDPALVVTEHRGELWPLPFLHARARPEPAERARAVAVLGGTAFFPPAQRGSLTLRFSGAQLAALGLRWVEHERYADAMAFLFEPERLPAVLPEAEGISGALRLLELQRQLDAATATGPNAIDDGAAPASGSLDAAVTIVFDEPPPIAPPPPAGGANDDPSPALPSPAPSDASSRHRLIGGAIAGALALIVIVALLARGRARRAGAALVLAAAAAAPIAAGARADDETPAAVPEEPRPEWLAVPPEAARLPVLIDGVTIVVEGLASPPEPLGPAKLLVPAGRHRVGVGDDSRIVESGSFTRSYQRLREADGGDTELIARFLREHAERPGDPIAAHLLGNYLARQGETAAATRCWLRALEANSAFVPAIANLAVGWAKDGRRPLGAAAARVAFALDPADAYGLRASLRAAVLAAGVREADLEGSAALEVLLTGREAPDPLDAEARRVVRFYHTLKKYLPDAVERAKADSNAGVYLQSRGRHERAARRFREAIHALYRPPEKEGEELLRDPVRAQVYDNLVRSLRELSKPEAAVYERVAELERGR